MITAVQPQRRRTRMDERITPCDCCGYPLSHRHHLLDFAGFGETPYTKQLCANCHDLYHICERAVNDIYLAGPNKKAKTRSVICLNHFVYCHPDGQSRLDYMLDLIRLVNKAKQEIKQEHDKQSANALKWFLEMGAD